MLNCEEPSLDYQFGPGLKLGMLTAELPDSILPRSRADESLLAEIVTQKFADHLPPHRLSEIFSRDGIQITHQLLSRWLIKLGAAPPWKPFIEP